MRPSATPQIQLETLFVLDDRGRILPTREPRPDAGEGVVAVHGEALLQRHFAGWVAGEIEAGAAPVPGVLVDGHPVSVCFCARRSAAAAEAGLETAPAFRGRGLAPRVASVWA